MSWHFSIAVVFVLFLATIVTLPALAGGWAVITLDQLPENILPGEPFALGFTVRQHGKNPMSGLTPSITFSPEEGGKPVTVIAKPDGKPGHYSANLVLPQAGIWDWKVNAFTMEQTMPRLVVLGAEPVQGSPPHSQAQFLLWGIAGFGTLFSGFLLLSRRNIRSAAAATVVVLAAVGAGFAVARSESAEPVQPDPPATQVDTGRALFQAKGCVVCHSHGEANVDTSQFSLEFGPDLTGYNADPAFLRLWLADPASIKPQTQMPDLELSETEVEALIAFINAGQD